MSKWDRAAKLGETRHGQVESGRPPCSVRPVEEVRKSSPRAAEGPAPARSRIAFPGLGAVGGDSGRAGGFAVASDFGLAGEQQHEVKPRHGCTCTGDRREAPPDGFCGHRRTEVLVPSPAIDPRTTSIITIAS